MEKYIKNLPINVNGVTDNRKIAKKGLAQTVRND